MFEVSSAKDLRGFWAKDYPLARHNSWHIGGPASYVYKPQDLKDCQRFYAWLHQVYPGVKTVWLGLGSNVLVPDAGVDAIVVLSRYGLNTLTHEPPYIRAEAGVTCAKFAKLSEKLGYKDGAFFAGIPGTMGGALVMNAGAFGHETWSYVVSVDVMAPDGTVQTHPASDFSWGYRLMQGLPKDHYFVAATFLFAKESQGMDIKALLAKREETQPIGSKSCGSVFKNPKGHHAAALIDGLGLKGMREGGMVVSLKHANFILNEGHGTSEQTCLLMQKVQERVKEAHGIMLEPEVIFL